MESSLIVDRSKSSFNNEELALASVNNVVIAELFLLLEIQNLNIIKQACRLIRRGTSAAAAWASEGKLGSVMTRDNLFFRAGRTEEWRSVLNEYSVEQQHIVADSVGLLEGDVYAYRH